MALTQGQGQRIDTGSVAHAGTELDTFAERVADRLKMIRDQVQNLSGSYSGKGALAFSRAMVEWDDTAVHVRKAVIELANLTRQGGVQHGEGDQNNADNMTRVASAQAFPGLGGPSK